MNRHEKALEILHNGTVIPAIPLALTQERTLDEASQRRMIRYYMAAGSGGVAAAVHSTQFEIRDPKHNLFRPVLETVVSEMEKFEAETGKVLVRISGVCGEAEQACAEAALAKELGFIYIDTGAMYRAIGLYIARSGVDARSAKAVAPRLSEIELRIAYVDGIQHIWLNGEDVSQAIRTEEASRYASDVSAIPEVRDHLLE